MENKGFNVGDRVRQTNAGRKGVGVICAVHDWLGPGSKLKYTVRWENGSETERYWYDLVLIERANNA